MTTEQKIAAHYARKDLGQEILDAIASTDAISIDDLAPYDEFHIGGRPATAHFIPQLGLGPDMHVLDVGCGIGGPARFVAHETGARVSGIDLTPEFIDTARLLSARCGLDGRTDFACGSALSMSYEDESFDAAYMIHVGMNIGDKEALYREIKRVLKPGGVFGIYDIFGNDKGPDFVFPAPWASTPDTSFLAQVGDVETLLIAAGFTVVHKEDRLGFAKAALEKMLAAALEKGGSPVMGAAFPEKLGNLIKNVEAGLCSPWEIICRK